MRILISNAIALTLGVLCLLQSTVEGQLSTDPLLMPVDLTNSTDPTINAANVNLDPNIYYYKPPTTLPYPAQPQCSAPVCNTGSCPTSQCYSVPPTYQSCPLPPVPPCGYNNGYCGYNTGCGSYNNGGYPYNNGGYNNGGYSYNNGGYPYNNGGCNNGGGGCGYNNRGCNYGGNCGPERGYYNYPQCSGYQNGGYPYQQGGYQY